MTNRLETGTRLVSQFLRWWAAELESCAYDLMGLFLPNRRRVLNVYWDATGFKFVDENSAEPKTIGQIPCAGGVADLPETLPAPLGMVRERNNRVRVFVSPDRAYVRQFQLPLTVLPHLRAAVALQLPKLLPLQAGELLTDYEVTAKDSIKNTASIDLAALKKAQVNPVLERLRAWGMHIVSTHLRNPADASHRFKFAADGVFSHRFELHRADRILLGVAATLGLACAAVAATESYRSHGSLERAKTLTHVPASAALVHRQELLSRLEPLSALSQLENAPSAPALLAEVTTLVPQNTYLTTLELKDRHVRIVGISPNSGNVVKLLSSSLLLNDVQMRSSMSVGIGTGLDRFEIMAELKVTTP